MDLVKELEAGSLLALCSESPEDWAGSEPANRKIVEHDDWNDWIVC